jgi:acetyltransferase-like isoleucine patch superfamily enzyme
LGGCGFVDSGVTIGDRVRIQNGVLIYNGVTVEDDVFLGPNMIFTNDLYPRADGRHWSIVPTRVCRGASIGANATIVCGVTIGEYAMVAAGSVVTKDIPPYTLVRGNPARAVGHVCVCGRKITPDVETINTVTCPTCARTIMLK